MMRAYWPGPTRLYDAEVDCGAPLLTGSQASAIIRAAESFLSEHPGDEYRDHILTALGVLRYTFHMEIQ